MALQLELSSWSHRCCRPQLTAANHRRAGNSFFNTTAPVTCQLHLLTDRRLAKECIMVLQHLIK